MSTFIFTQDSLTGRTSVPTVYAKVDGSKVRIFENSANSSTQTESLKTFLGSLGVGLKTDGGIDWSSVSIEPYSWTLGFPTMPVSALPSRTTDKYLLSITANDLLGASPSFFETTLAKLDLPSKTKISEITVVDGTTDPAGLDRLSVSVDQLVKLAKSGAKVGNVTLSVNDGIEAVKVLLKSKPADLKALGNVEINITPEQIASLIKDKLIDDKLVQSFTTSGISFNVAVETAASLASLVAFNTDFSSFSTIGVNLGMGLTSPGGVLVTGTKEQQKAKTEQLGEFITSFSGKKLVVDPGVLMKLVSEGVIWELQPEIGTLKSTIDIRLQASLDRLMELRTPSSSFHNDEYKYDVTLSDYNVTQAINSFARGLTIVSDDNGKSFISDAQNDDATVNSNLIKANGVFPGPDQITSYSGILGDIYSQAFYKAKYEDKKSDLQSLDAARQALSKVELKSSSGTLLVSMDLVDVASEVGFKFADSDQVSLDISYGSVDASKLDLVSTFQTSGSDGYTWRNDLEFSNQGKDGEVDNINDLFALGMRFRNWYNAGDINSNGQDDAYEQVFVPNEKGGGINVSKIDWMFGFDGSNNKSFWTSVNQEWLNARATLDRNADQGQTGSQVTFLGTGFSTIEALDAAFLEANPNVGFADLNGDGRAELPGNEGTSTTLSFALLRSLQTRGVDNVVSSNDIVIDISREGNEGDSFTLKSVVNFLKSTKLNFTKADGTVAKLSVDADQPVSLNFADIDLLSKKGVSLVDSNGAGLISLSAVQSDLIAGFKTITITQASAMQLAGVSVINVLDSKKLTLTVEQAKAIAVGGLNFSSNSFVALVDTAAAISSLSAAQISALGAMGLNQIDASDGDKNEIVFTDRQIRALTRADIIVASDDKLRSKITDDYILKALTDPQANLGVVLEELAAVGVDTISGTTEGLKITAKMLTDAAPMLFTPANKLGLLKIADVKGVVSDKLPLTGLIVSYESDSELTFLPLPKAELEAQGVKFVKAEVKTFGVAGTAGNSIAKPAFEIAVGKDVVITPGKFLTQKDAAKKDIALTDLSLINDNERFEFVMKIRQADESNSTAVEFNDQDFYFSKFKNSDYDGNGVSDVWQWYDWDLKPFQRDFNRDSGRDDSNLPRFTLKLTDSLRDLIKDVNGGPMTIKVEIQPGVFESFDVDVDRGRMDFLNNSYNWLTVDDLNNDEGDFVVLRVIDDAKFEKAVSHLGQLPDNTWQGATYINWVNNLLNSSQISSKAIKSDEVFTVTLDDEQLELNGNNEYVVRITGAQLKAGALVVTPNYGAVDSEGKSLIENISFSGGQGEKTVFSFSSALNGVNWWNKSSAITVTANPETNVTFTSESAWAYAQEVGGSVNTNIDGSFAVSLVQRDITLNVGDLLQTGSPLGAISFRLPTWVSDTYEAARQVASILNGSESWMTGSSASELYQTYIWWYKERGIDESELEKLLAMSEKITFSDDAGRLVAKYKNSGDVGADLLVFAESSQTDQDGIDVIQSDMYAGTKTQKFVSVASTALLTVGDELKFKINVGATASVAQEKATFSIKITDKMVADAKGDQNLLLLNAIKAAVPADIKIGTGKESIVLLNAKTGITATQNSDAVKFVFATNLPKVNNISQDVSLSIETVKESGTLVVLKSSQDGTGGKVTWDTNSIRVADFNQAPKVSTSNNPQEMVAILGATTVSLSSINIVDDSKDILVTLSPSRGVYSGSFAYVDSSLISKFIANGSLKLSYMGEKGMTPLPDKIPSGVGKIFIEAHQTQITIDADTGETVTYKASDLVNLVLSSTNFQLNRSLYTRDESVDVKFDLAINDSYSVANSTFAKDGDRLIVGSVTHNGIGDENTDGKVDINDTVVKVSALKQLVTTAEDNGLDIGLYRTDNSVDGINDLASNAKLFNVTNKSLVHQFNSAYADMIVEEGLGSTSAIYLHADASLNYSLDSYAKSGFAAIYNETGGEFYQTVSMVNSLQKLGTQIIGDTIIEFESESAETLKIPLTSLSLLTQWNADSDQNMSTSGSWGESLDEVADYLIHGVGAGDKIDLSSLFSKTALTYITDDEATDLVQGQSSTSLSGLQWYAVNDTESQVVRIFGGDVSATSSTGEPDGQISVKLQFEIDLAGLSTSYIDSSNKFTFLV